MSASVSVDCTVMLVEPFSLPRVKLPERERAVERLVKVSLEILWAVATRRISSSCAPVEALFETLTPIKLPAADGVTPSLRLVLAKACFDAKLSPELAKLIAPRIPSMAVCSVSREVRSSRSAVILVVFSSILASRLTAGKRFAAMMLSTAPAMSIPVPRPEKETRPVWLSTFSESRLRSIFRCV